METADRQAAAGVVAEVAEAEAGVVAEEEEEAAEEEAEVAAAYLR